jgi:hypothetical protein
MHDFCRRLGGKTKCADDNSDDVTFCAHCEAVASVWKNGSDWPWFDGLHHHISNELAADPDRGRRKGNSLPITSIEPEGHPNAFAVVAADLEAIRAIANVAYIHPMLPRRIHATAVDL